ncbi:hypothetical protein [Yoonia sp. SS1-5]|uniref:Uncharacterized protein n=1 Tax=Yoonia rhodophyticola TaxID=3137370 RepID=A0AAN0NJA6_9RHOB
MRTTWIILAGMLAAPAAAQSYSESMAECAAIHQNAAQWVRSDDAVEKLLIATRRWAEAAIMQAEVEGIADPENVIWAMIDRKTGEWEAKGPDVFTTEEFHDWVAYCRAFGQEFGIVLDA